MYNLVWVILGFNEETGVIQSPDDLQTDLLKACVPRGSICI